MPTDGADSMGSGWQRQTGASGQLSSLQALLLPQDENISQSRAGSRKGGSNPGLSCPRVGQ